jgi:cytochrome c553
MPLASARNARAIPPPCGEVDARSAVGGGALPRRSEPHPCPLPTRGRGTLWHGRAPLLVTIVVALCTTAANAAGDIAAGRRKALQCQTCHGVDGLSKLPEAPHLAGQPEPYLVKSLNDYRTGARRHDMMTLVVQPLTDQDVADLAAYYAAIEISTTPPK